MNGQNNKIRIESEPFRQFTSALYQRAGVPKADAVAVAGMQVETDERGVFSHGTRALPGYVRGILNGEINPKPTPQVLTDAPSTALVDADNSLGHVAGIYAMNMAIEKADATGFASVAVRNSNHYGAAACFAMMALPKGNDRLQHYQNGWGKCRTARRDVGTARQSSCWLRNTD